MPTKKRRVGFIPRSDVIVLINNLSIESNLSISKVINILVEEALYNRGMFNIKSGKVLNYEDKKNNLNNENRLSIKNDDKGFSNVFNNLKSTENHHIKKTGDEFIDKEIYEKFLMFLQFQEKMKKKS